MWQAEADTEVTLSALPATAVGQNHGEILLSSIRYMVFRVGIFNPEHYLILGLLGQGLLQRSNSNCVECSSFCGYVLFLKWTSGCILHIHPIGKEEI